VTHIVVTAKHASRVIFTYAVLHAVQYFRIVVVLLKDGRALSAGLTAGFLSGQCSVRHAQRPYRPALRQCQSIDLLLLSAAAAAAAAASMPALQDD